MLGIAGFGYDFVSGGGVWFLWCMLLVVLVLELCCFWLFVFGCDVGFLVLL